MKQLSVSEWRNKLGQLRQSDEVTVILYRRRPAALMVPIPPAFWQDSDPYLHQVLSIRDEFLQPPHAERVHGWVQEGGEYELVRCPFEDARRGSAQLFGQIVRNTPVVLTFYTQYDGAIMVPLPPDLDASILEQMHQRVETFA